MARLGRGQPFRRTTRSVVLTTTPTSYTLIADPGSYAWTGTNASLKVGRLVTGSTGSYAWPGTSAGLRVTRLISASAGSYTWSGTAAGLRATRLLTASGSSYAWTGTSASLNKGRTLAASAGSYAWTGTSAGLKPVRFITAIGSSYAWTGISATLSVNVFTEITGMTILASTVLTDCRTGLLNDPSGAIYADTPMYSLMNKAYHELQNKLAAIGLSTATEVSTAIAVPAGTNFLGDGALLPSDFLYPIWLKERATGSTSADDYTDMIEVGVEPFTAATPTLGFWAFREEEIKFPIDGATTARDVLMKYKKSLGSVTTGNSVIRVINSAEWIAQRTASLAALVIGGNPRRSEALSEDLKQLWDDLKVTLIRRGQNKPLRRGRTRYRTKG